MTAIAGVSGRLGNYGFAVQSAKGTPAASPTVRVFAAGQPSLQPFIQDAR
jgi:hypothetical protein